jgi:hypothetical protein
MFVVYTLKVPCGCHPLKVPCGCLSHRLNRLPVIFRLDDGRHCAATASQWSQWSAFVLLTDDGKFQAKAVVTDHFSTASVCGETFSLVVNDIDALAEELQRDYVGGAHRGVLPGGQQFRD